MGRAPRIMGKWARTLSLFNFAKDKSLPPINFVRDNSHLSSYIKRPLQELREYCQKAKTPNPTPCTNKHEEEVRKKKKKTKKVFGLTYIDNEKKKSSQQKKSDHPESNQGPRDFNL